MNGLYQQLFEELPCYVSVQDRNFRLIATNRMFRNDFVVEPGSYCFQVYKGRTEMCPSCPVMQTFEDGQTHCSEEVVKRKDGEEVHVIVYTSPIRGPNKEINSVLEISADITGVKRLQQKYHALFEEAPCYISVQDRDLNILEANRSFRMDFGSGIGQHCYEVYKHRTEPCIHCPVAETFQDGKTHSGEEVVTSESGKRVNVLSHTAPILNSAGEIDSVIEMSTNITDLRQLQSQLTSLGLIVSSVSHGIKGLLSGLDGGIYLMDTGFERDDMNRIKQGWDMVQRNVGRIRSMVMNILYYAKDREIFYQSIDLDELASSLRELLGGRADRHGINLSIETEGDTFEGDQNSVQSLLVNLIENSIDACRVDKEKSSHRITMSAKVDGNEVIFAIADNGIGMDRETKEKAFSLFFSSKGAEGTGLGLFIASKIVKSHGGTIKIDSSPGVGTSFLVKLPRLRPLAQSQDSSPDAGASCDLPD